MMRDKLSIIGMIFHAYHGLEEHEMSNGQRFEVDVDLLLDSSHAAASDDIKKTVDVRKVYNLVNNIVAKQRFCLIETVSQRIADSLMAEFDIQEITVRVRKPFAPLGGLTHGTSIEISRKKP
jgi:dihydroneopterin aldolase